MTNGVGKDGILDVIRALSAQGATGRLRLSTGTTEGALSFDRGEVVDARLANLSGFQAINALASVPDGRYSFDPAIPPPARSSISSNERVLLKDFFGIEAANVEQAQSIPEYDDDEATLIGSTPKVVEPLPAPPILADPDPEPVVAEPVVAPVFAHSIVAEPVVAEPVAAEPMPSFQYQPAARSTFRPAFFFVLLTALIAVAAIAILYRLRKPEAPTSTVSTPAPTDISQAPPTEQPTAPATVATTSAVPVPDLTGNWSVVNTVEQTSYQAYKNMRVGFNVSINQTGKDFTGKGEKISENGQTLPADSRTPIVVKGSINGDKVEATFSESGAIRKTNGRFVWRIDKASGRLNGTFSSTAARTRGRSNAKKGS